MIIFGKWLFYWLLAFQFDQTAKKSVWLLAFWLAEKLAFKPKWKGCLEQLFGLAFGLLAHKLSNKQPTSTINFAKHFYKQLA